MTFAAAEMTFGGRFIIDRNLTRLAPLAGTR
jgi:hypothetical protein